MSSTTTLSYPLQEIVSPTTVPNSGLPMSLACDGTGQYVAYASTLPNTGGSGNTYYYGNTWYSSDYGVSFTQMPGITFTYSGSGSLYSLTSVSLSVVSATINNAQQAYLMQSFTYTIPDPSNQNISIPYSYLYYFNLTTKGSLPTVVNVTSGLSSTSTNFSNIENVLVTSIINNNTSVNGQCFVFLVTQVYQDATISKNSALNQWVCQFNPFAGNSAFNIPNNTYFASYTQQGGGYPFVINNNLATTQSTITLTPAVSSSAYNYLIGVAYESAVNVYNNILIGPGNTSQIQNQQNSNSYYYLNLGSSTTVKTYNSIPVSPNYSQYSLQMYNVGSNSELLFLSNNINYNSDLSSNITLSNTSYLYVYLITNLNSYKTYNLQNTSGIVTSAAGYDTNKYAVLLPEQIISTSSSGIYYNNDLTYNSSSTSFVLDTGFSKPSYNYWLCGSTNALGNYNYFSSSNNSGTGGYVYSIYNYLTTTVLTNNSTNVYNFYPNSNNNQNYDGSYNITYTNFALELDPTTNQPYQYLNFYIVGPGGNGYASTKGSDCGGGGGGAAQAVQIPYSVIDSVGNSIVMTSLNIQVNSNNSSLPTTTVICEWTQNNSSINYYLNITANTGNAGTASTGGLGGSATVTAENISSFYNTTEYTVTQVGANATNNSNPGVEGATNTNSESGITATGAVSGSYYSENSTSQSVTIDLFGTKNTTFTYKSIGAATGNSNNSLTLAANGGGGSGINTNLVGNKYSIGANGFVCMWLTS